MSKEKEMALETTSKEFALEAVEILYNSGMSDQKSEVTYKNMLACKNILIDALAQHNAPEADAIVYWHVMIDETGQQIRHEFTFENKHPFGYPDIDFDKLFQIKSYPLYTKPQPAQDDKDSIISDLREQVRYLLELRARNAPIDLSKAYRQPAQTNVERIEVVPHHIMHTMKNLDDAIAHGELSEKNAYPQLRGAINRHMKEALRNDKSE